VKDTGAPRLDANIALRGPACSPQFPSSRGHEARALLRIPAESSAFQHGAIGASADAALRSHSGVGEHNKTGQHKDCRRYLTVCNANGYLQRPRPCWTACNSRRRRRYTVHASHLTAVQTAGLPYIASYSASSIYGRWLGSPRTRLRHHHTAGPAGRRRRQR
jgi:hypothetical protein